jgi:hypothetical protein
MPPPVTGLSSKPTFAHWDARDQERRSPNTTQQIRSISDAATSQETYASIVGSRTRASSFLPKNVTSPTYVSLDEARAQYHVRDPELNNIPLFSSRYEEPESHAIDALPAEEQEQKKGFHAVKMIAKGAEFVHRETGESIFSNPAVGATNPPLSMQDKQERELRAKAGTIVLSQYSGKFIKDLYDNVLKQLKGSGLSDSQEKITVHLVRPVRARRLDDYVINFLSLTTQSELKDALNAEEVRRQKSKTGEESPGDLPEIEFSDFKNCIELHRTEDSASPLGRIAQQGYFDTSEIGENDKVVIVDDYASGSTFLPMATALEQAGAHVLAAAALDAHPYLASAAPDASFALSKDVRNLLDDTFPARHKRCLETQLKKMGMSFDTLTNHEAMTLIACATDPGNEQALENFRTVERTLTRTEEESSPLEAVLQQKRLSPNQMVAELENVRSARKTVESVPIEEKHIFDYDDCVRERKRLNYQLFDNALAICKHSEHGTNFPLIGEIFDTLRAVQELSETHQGQTDELKGNQESEERQLGNGRSQIAIRKRETQRLLTRQDREMRVLCGVQDGAPHVMPKICMSMKAFAEYSMENDFGCLKMVDDLIDHLSGMDPSLGQRISGNGSTGNQMETSMQEQGIRNILKAEFARQYKQLIQSPQPENRISRLEEAGAPYPGVKLEFMKGAEALLDQLMRPNTRVYLNSNSEHTDIRKELHSLLVNGLPLMEFFDGFSGVQEGHIFNENGEIVKIGRLNEKDDPTRSKELLERDPGGHDAPLISWGDRGKDITQIENIPHDGEKEGRLVHPNGSFLEDVQDKVSFLVRHFRNFTEAM